MSDALPTVALKGAEAGIYGIRGFNGVIVITTKKPGKGTRYAA